MTVLAEADLEYWRAVLAESGSTTIPRWTLEPRAGAAEHRLTVPEELMSSLHRLAGTLAVPVSAVLLAAHAKVLAALAGEAEVTTGYVLAGRPLPCRVSTAWPTWRELLLAAHRAESDLLLHADVPVAELQRELGSSVPPFETAVDPVGDADPVEGVVLQVALTSTAAHSGLRLRYRTEVLDAESAARTAGYHLRALALMVDDPEAEHARQSLLSAEELHTQREDLVGRRRALPDRRLHELFEDQVAAHPEAVAAVQGDRRWTYAELDARADRLGRALLARGLDREDVVAVVSERTLDWLAAVLAVFKAGGVYLPVEPHFPAARVATMLSRAGCRLALAAPGSTASLDEALADLPGIEKVDVETAYAEPHPPGPLGVPVTAGQLAYLYFTSGSTGEPKGALCEHRGMLNHVLAKIEDLEVGPDRVVAQTAPQCFDISLWQLVAALLVGGRTLIVEQEAILDVERFVDTVVQGRVAVLQLVPSYLEVVLTYLEQHPRELPDLRVVSVTGEAVKKELVERWFAARPGTRLVNAYGLTETSDDTNHEVMDAPPAGDRVPLGRPLPNVDVYVVDEQLTPVPLGAPGAIVFSGICLARGYVNDPERTRQAFAADPHQPGRRLYRAGDFGRWRPDGKLEFLGRRDHQVKIAGFRIEIGDIENALLRQPGVGDGAVVVAERPGQPKRLVAFYSGPQPVESALLQAGLAQSLPPYMVPTTYRWHRQLPLTANSKIDRAALTALAQDLEPATADGHAPRTPTERRLAAAWAEVLGVPVARVGRLDHFFDHGGTSLGAVKLAIALDRAVSLRELTRHPVLADLAELMDHRTSERRPDLLQRLSGPAGTPSASLVCFPPAGGHALGFQPLARALEGSSMAVHAVELPGHDLAGTPEPLQPLTQVVERVTDEIVAAGLGPVLLWGHSSGAAFALATARALLARGVDVRRVFFAAQLLGTPTERRAAVAQLTGRRSADLGAALAADGGYEELAEQDPQRAEQAGAAYRHDCISAHQHLAGLLEDPSVPRLPVPVTVVVATDDPHTAAARQRYRDLERLVEHVDLHEVAGGGHFFVRTCPRAAATAVLLEADLLVTS